MQISGNFSFLGYGSAPWHDNRVLAVARNDNNNFLVVELVISPCYCFMQIYGKFEFPNTINRAKNVKIGASRVLQ